jgi:DNA-directed RNA polymerase subunit RPC12/RpoP
MVVCPKCRSDRLVLLTFSAALGDEKLDLPERPVAKCANCGHRLSAAEVAAQEGSTSI